MCTWYVYSIIQEDLQKNTKLKNVIRRGEHKCQARFFAKICLRRTLAF